MAFWASEGGMVQLPFPREWPPQHMAGWKASNAAMTTAMCHPDAAHVHDLHPSHDFDLCGVSGLHSWDQMAFPIFEIFMNSTHKMPPWGYRSSWLQGQLIHTCSLKSPVSPCALVSLEAKQKLGAVLSLRGVARIKRQDLQKAGWHRGETSPTLRCPVWIMFSGVWAKFKMGMLCHLLWLIFWVLPTHSGKWTEVDPAAPSHPTQTFQSLALCCLDPFIHLIQGLTCRLSWSNQPKMVCCCV